MSETQQPDALFAESGPLGCSRRVPLLQWQPQTLRHEPDPLLSNA
jgi:hypothetical protein